MCLGGQETPHGNRMSSRQQSRLLALGSNGSCQTIEAGKSQVDRHGDYMYHDKASDSRPVLWFIFCQRMRLLRVTTHALLGLLPYSTNIRALTGWVSSAGISIPPGLCAELLGICSQARITYIHCRSHIYTEEWCCAQILQHALLPSCTLQNSIEPRGYSLSFRTLRGRSSQDPSERFLDHWCPSSTCR